MQITPLGEHTGAEVTGIDLKGSIDDATRQKLNQALVDHVCLVIRDQDYTPDDYIKAVRVFGEPDDQYFEDFSLPDYPMINLVSSRHTDSEGKPNKRGSGWHTDQTNHERPPKCTILYAVELPERGGDTGVCNMRMAYESLPDDFKQKIDGLKTVNVFYGRAAARPSVKGKELQSKREYDPYIHPLVRTHPESGKKSIYFNDNKTDTIVGMTPEDTRDLLREISERAVRPEFMYRHRWRKGDMMLFDNRQAMHKAFHDYDRTQHRLFYRIILKGDRPV